MQPKKQHMQQARVVSLVAATVLLALSGQAQSAQTRSAQASQQVATAFESAVTAQERARWQEHSQRVGIQRDDWGIAHVQGKSDADAVFGMIYAQAEDDFPRIETNYLNALGRLAEAQGESAIYQDLRLKLFIDPVDLRARYATSPEWLKTLMVAWADGLNYYLHTHPAVAPRVIRHFEPWMALSFTEGSIGGDIATVSVSELEAFYGGRKVARRDDIDPALKEPTGSNGFAIAPANTKGRHALLLINPHTTFFFRSELQVRSEQGLDAYGAATWGQFFIYQGFNPRLGWMHTTSGVDVVDEFLETIVRKDGKVYYRYGSELRPVTTSTITVPYRRAADGRMSSKSFTVYKTHHGPVVREHDGKWVSVALMYKPVEALQQSYLRTKARDFKAYMKIMELRANSSNNTIFADADGNIAYLHPQFVPKRNDDFDYTRPVDGSNPATDWQGLHALDELPHLLNPANGWIMNTNNWPYSAAGANSPKRADYQRYMDTFGENPRGLLAQRVLSNKSDFTLSSLIAAAYDPYLTAFARLVPVLVRAYDQLPDTHASKQQLRGQVDLLRGWDYRWSVDSAPTSLAVFWGEALWKELMAEAGRSGMPVHEYVAQHATAEQLLQALAEASTRLTKDFGGWRIPWGEINRYQRLTGDIDQPFNDSAPSIPVGFTSGRWGSLASFGAHAYPGTKRYYGTNGNSFVAVVEFGDKVRARAVSTGGESGDPRSPHFNDQAQRYSTGDLREVYFYPADIKAHTRKEYRPGQ